ncbi:proteoglycan 3-like [Hippopotamus amphibius kiboko]|uniref:proteoglycan 3-like n=1 Tax=Hippopotamus amphibius kiboko TaxID=575201 RepID=UPI00259735C7|nr:proteoglycan 3-like [Hippopotamus amphibius kiboko]
MKHLLLLPLLLLGTVSALSLENGGPHLGSREPQADLSQDVEGSGEQEGGLALNDEVLESEEDEAETCSSQDDCEDEKAMESDPAAPHKDLPCPKEEDTIQLPGSPGCKSCHYVLVLTPRKFWNGQNICRRCYRGNLVSIHNFSFNSQVRHLANRVNEAQVWIGGYIRGWLLCRRFRWADGSRWDFGYWARGQPGNGRGHCVALCSKGGHWRRASCKRRLPFVCLF